MTKHLSPASEDYLKAIYALTQEGGRASTNDIAEQMGVTPASATGMVQKLAAADPPLVEYQKHRGVSLTAEGNQTALEIIRHHRLLELFLQEKMGYTWDQVHGEADRLEHVISEDMEERIAQALGDPAYDPHGDPIPSREFRMPLRSSKRLSELGRGESASVQRILSDDPDLLRYLASIGLTPGSRITVLGASAFDGNLRLQIEGRAGELVLGPRITSLVFMEYD